MAEAILAGIRVVDFTTAGAGPRSTSQLAKLGADVLKLEPRTGNSTTRQRPQQGGTSTHYTTLMFNKRSVYFDPHASTPDQRRDIINWADVLVQNLKPGSLESYGFGYDECRAINPGLVYVSISAWGERGPLARFPGADPNGSAYAGWPSHTGRAGGAPEFPRGSGLVDHLTGTFAATAAILGLRRRAQVGAGSYTHVSLMNSALWAETHRLPGAVLDDVPRPAGSKSGQFAPDWAVRCADGLDIAITIRTDEEWRRFCVALGRSGLADDARFATNPLRVQHQDALSAIVDEVMFRRAVYWWTLQFDQHEIPYAVAQIYPALKDNPQIVANRYVRDHIVPGRGKFTLPEHPWQFSRSELAERLPPMPGDDTAYLDQLERAPRTPHTASQLSASASGAWLADLVIGDATQGLAGPLATSLYAALGATVLKYEPPSGDYARHAAPLLSGSGPSLPFLALNVGKTFETAPLDPAKLDVLVVDQDSAWLGLDLEALQAAYPKLVLCRMSANGPLGPRRNTKGGELTSQVQAEYHTGLGRPEDGTIMRVGPDIVTAVTAAASFQGTLAALFERDRSGRGQVVDVGMLGTALFARLPMWSVLGEPDEWVGHLCDSYALPPDYGYSTRDGHVDFATNRMKEADYAEFLRRLGLLEQARSDTRFDMEHAGAATSFAGPYGKEFMDIWSRAFSRFSTAEITDMINELGGTATPMHDLGQVIDAPQVVANGLITQVETHGVKIPVVRPPLIGAGTLWTVEAATESRQSVAGVA